MESIVTKYCKRCNSYKSNSDFRLRKNKDKLFRVSICASCEKKENNERLRMSRLKEPNRFRSYQKKSYERNKEINNVRSKKYYEKHKSTLKIKFKEWKRRNSDKILDYETKRRALKNQAKVEKVERSKVYERDNGVCHICKKVVGKIWHLDHIIPLSKGGEHSYRNVAVSHAFCNLSKYTKVL